jgi:DNA polymerase III alpha subunit (gram-positive type)
MKIMQDLIVFDLEATSSQSAEGHQENNNIIQIGAVYLKKIDNKKYEITDRFNETIKPKNEVISSFIEELTGITNEAVKDKNYFDHAGNAFQEWAIKNGNIKSIRLCAWGNYFDVPLLRKHYEKFNIKYPFSGTAYDIKSWTALWLMLSGRRTDKMSVESISQLMGIKPQGKFHDASVDAEMTAKIALRIFEDLDNGIFVDNDKNGKADHFKLARS